MRHTWMCSLVFRLLLHEIARTKLINSFSVLKKYRDKFMCFFAKLNLLIIEHQLSSLSFTQNARKKYIYYGFCHLSLVASVTFFLENNFRNIWRFFSHPLLCARYYNCSNCQRPAKIAFPNSFNLEKQPRIDRQDILKHANVSCIWWNSPFWWDVIAYTLSYLSEVLVLSGIKPTKNWSWCFYNLTTYLRFVVKHISISHARDFIYLIVSIFIFNGMTVNTRKKGIGIHEKQTVSILNNIVACLSFQFHNSWYSHHTLKQWHHSCHTNDGQPWKKKISICWAKQRREYFHLFISKKPGKLTPVARVSYWTYWVFSAFCCLTIKHTKIIYTCSGRVRGCDVFLCFKLS